MENLSNFRSFDSLLPKPLAFFAWKHHLGYIIEKVNAVKHDISDENISTVCQGLGSTVIDLYIGNLSARNIADQVIEQFQRTNILSVENYSNWVNSSGKEYRLHTISDGSSWTFRMGRQTGRYIHIHPSRHSKCTIRLRSSVLKTALAARLQYPNMKLLPNVEQLNAVRTNFPNLSPLSIGEMHKSILTMLHLFFHRFYSFIGPQRDMQKG